MSHYTVDGALVQASHTITDVNTYGHIYLSPHPDDAVLSCGGRIWQQVQPGGHVLVVTVFGNVPAPGRPLSLFAEGLHARWGHTADAAVQRQEEDLAALALLGAATAHWPYTDCIYRQTPDGRFPYDSEESLWEQVHPAEQVLITELAARIRALPLSQDGTIYVPLTVGHHIDHQITRQAAEASRQSLTYYEEYPYAEDLQAVHQALAGDLWQARPTWLSEQALQAKIAAIACYRSQLSTFWANEAEMATKVWAFAERTGGGKLAERYWIREPGWWPQADGDRPLIPNP